MSLVVDDNINEQTVVILKKPNNSLVAAKIQRRGYVAIVTACRLSAASGERERQDQDRFPRHLAHPLPVS